MRSFLTYQRWNSNTVNLHVHILLHLYPCFIFNTFPSCYFLSFPGFRGAGGEGDLGSHGCSWWQWGDSGWRNLHREVHSGRFGSWEHSQSGEVTAGIVKKKKKIHTWPTGLWKKLGLLLYRINVEILHKRLYLQRWHPSFSGCDSEGSAQHEGQTPKTEYQHTKCTTCNGLTTHCNTELSLLPECKINCFEIWLDSDSRLLFLQTSCSKTDLTGCEDDDCKVGHSSGDVYRLERNNFMT